MRGRDFTGCLCGELVPLCRVEYHYECACGVKQCVSCLGLDKKKRVDEE